MKNCLSNQLNQVKGLWKMKYLTVFFKLSFIFEIKEFLNFENQTLPSNYQTNYFMDFELLLSY